MHIERSFRVDKPIGEVFEYLADVTNEAKWNPWAQWVRKVSDGPVGSGAVFRGSYKGFGELEQDLSDYDPPARVTYHSVPKGMRDASMTFDLAANGANTTVRVAGDVWPKGLMKLMEPLMRMRMRPHIADICEGIRRELTSSR